MSTLTQRKTRSYIIGDEYAALLDRYPLLPIKDEVDYKRAIEVLEDLFGRADLSADQSGYLDTLVLLVRKYEDETSPIDGAMTPVEALRALMRANGLDQSDLAKLLGSQPLASMILSGSRLISAKVARVLARRFSVEIGTFLPA